MVDRELTMVYGAGRKHLVGGSQDVCKRALQHCGLFHLINFIADQQPDSAEVA